LLIADEWEADPNKATLRHPVQGTARAWVEFADSPGIKSEPRVSEKMKNDYGGHANKLKDLARLTLRFSSCSRMAHALAEGLKEAGVEVLKNKYASPTPMGYSDLGISCAGVVLPDVVRYVCEIQLNHVDMLEAKKEAHVYNEEVCKELPALCQGTKVDAGELVAFIVGRLSTASLDAAVDAHSAKAEGLFLFAYMLGQHLESEAKKGRAIHSRISTRSRPGRGVRRQLRARLSIGRPRVDRGEAPRRADCGSARADHGVNGGGAPSMGRQAAEERA
jgi:hypothetical protein